MATSKSFCTANHILVGLGGTGGKILREFKMRLFEEFPTAEERKLPVALLYVDSTDEMMPKDGRARADFRVMGQDASFTPKEFLNIKAVDVEHILDHIGNYPAVKGIVENAEAVRSAIGSLGQAAGQKRRAGRLLFAANAVAYVNALKDAYARCEAISGDANKKYIYIFAGLCGGTGSGSVVDALLQARKTFPDAIISVYCMIPEMNLPKSNMDQGRYYQNGYAAINELNAIQAGRFFPQDVTGTGPISKNIYTDAVHGVANGLTVYSNVNENGMTVNSLSELPKILSDYIFARIFFINEEDDKHFGDILRAYNYENMDDFANEFDEAADREGGKVPVARTKKVNSIGIKRVMYPELRVLKHITYTVGESVLYQFKYNNWRENQGFVDEERNKDYRKDYLNSDNLQAWNLDERHLTYEAKVLESDADYPSFNDYWHDKSIAYAEEAKKADCPLNELDNILAEFYEKHFREEGVEAFYAGKERAIPEISKEIRYKIENTLFDKWKVGDVSIVELQKVSKLLLERMGEIRQELESRTKELKENYDATDEDRDANVNEWSRLGILQRMVGVGARRYADHQNILTDYYELKTQLVAIEFAKKLAAKVFVELGKMDADILAFSQKINEAIEETERLVAAQKKVNKGLEDMRGAIVEVSEEEAMGEFEVDLKTDKIDMPNIARQIRESILPQGDFVNFGRLAADISIDDVTDAFDIKLSKIVKAKHDEKADSDEKVLGLNILTQLQQKLKTEDDIKEFASKIVRQSGVYLRLNNDQMQLHLRNNEGPLSPTNPASVNKKTILVSFPSPDDNPNLSKFAQKLEDAFKSQFGNGAAQNSIIINKQSQRKDELSVITIQYCFPLRAIDWLSTYKERYDRFLNTGNSATDVVNSILLHSEGDGKDLPSLFALSEAEIEKVRAARQAAQQPQGFAPQQPQGFAPQQAAAPMGGPGVPPPPPGGTVPPPPPGAFVKPQIQLHLSVGGQQYGPYNYDQVEQYVKAGSITAQSLVWMASLPGWTPAGQVPELQPLFAPAPPAPGAVPPPPGPGSVPPPPPAM
ncbi:MAG: DUF4339 domain-containing protein [Prevotella sp.]|nr:DUF4339 domain-containing protein [Prevotella sp.]